MTVVTSKGRWPIILGVAAAIILIIGALHETKHRLPAGEVKVWPLHDAEAETDSSQAASVHGQIVGEGQMASQQDSVLSDTLAQAAEQDQALPQVQSGPPLSQKELSFYEIAIKYGTDKVTDHSYQDMYQHYLPALRHKPIKMLEIGLGCDMSYGPGASYHLWLEYFTNVELYFLEYDAECAAQWAHATAGATIITGDQGDGEVLDKLVQDHGNDFDIIIDDGGHTMVQQQTSLEHLWRAVKPGGMYFCEDLQTSYWDNYGGGAAAITSGMVTMVQYIQLLIEDLTWGARRVVFPEADQIVHIDCSREVCGFFKRAAPTINL